MDSFTAWEIVRYTFVAIVFYYFAKEAVWVISDFLHWVKTGKDGWDFFRSLTRLAVYIGLVLLFFKVAPTVIEVVKEEYNQII